MRKNPAHCVYAAGPNRATFSNCLRLVKAPCSLRYAIILFATVLEIPDTCFKMAGDAVFNSTPTWFTTVSTT